MPLNLIAMLMLFASPTPQSAPPICPRDAAPVPIAFATWGQSKPLTTGDAALAPVIQPGQAVDLTLSPQAEVALAATPGRAASPGHHAGLVRLRIADSAKYRLALGAGAWVDVVRDGAVLTSLSHGHGPACSGIRKIVDFDLTPGDYLIQISASPAATVRLLVAAE